MCLVRGYMYDCPGAMLGMVKRWSSVLVDGAIAFILAWVLPTEAHAQRAAAGTAFLVFDGSRLSTWNMASRFRTSG
jgi:hypothetical protein